MDYWFNKAQELLEDYIDAFLHADATEEELDKVNMVKHSHSQTYNERRRRWVR
jgi:hypothetical protein